MNAIGSSSINPAFGATFLRKSIRTVLGLVFLIAGFEKAISPSQIKTVLIFDGFSELQVSLLSWSIVLAEIALGQALLLGLATRVVGRIAIGALVIYSAQLSYLLVKQHAPDCGCLKLLQSYANGRKSNLFGLLRNSVLIVLTLFVLKRGNARSNN